MTRIRAEYILFRMLKRHRSQRIVLVLIGAAALPACMPVTQRVVTDRYASLEDCSADWVGPDVCDRDDESRPLAGNFGGLAYLSEPELPRGRPRGAQYEARRQACNSARVDMSPLRVGTHAIEQSVPSRGGFGLHRPTSSGDSADAQGASGAARRLATADGIARIRYHSIDGVYWDESRCY